MLRIALPKGLSRREYLGLIEALQRVKFDCMTVIKVPV